MNTSKRGLLSICCLGYNHARFIPAALKSMWCIDPSNVEIIAVDDGSTDGSQDLLKTLQKESPIPMKLILQENTGNIGKNFNSALKQARGEFIIFISLDDVLCSDTVKKYLGNMQKNEKIIFTASSECSAIDENNSKIRDVKLPISRKESITLQDLLDLDWHFGSFYIQNAILRKDIVDSVGGFDEDMIGDDIVLRTKLFRKMIELEKNDFKIIKEPLFSYRLHGTNVHINTALQIKNVTQYLERYWPNRENPPELYEWIEGAIAHSSYETMWEMLSFNQRASSVLQSKQIQNVIEKKILQKYSWLRFVYRKERINNIRQITLFSCFSFTYKRKTFE